MKHLGSVSRLMEKKALDMVRRSPAEPGYADAKTDLMNALWRDWITFLTQKKNEVSV